MKVNVIKDKCIGCGNCVSLTEGEIFDFNEEGLAEAIVDVVPEDLEDTAKDAIVQCPTEAIEEVKEEEK
ncbi:MAG: ferredoxin [Bacilli bacterium]|nr:ferredoxin [Bacilli bacterium]